MSTHMHPDYNGGPAFPSEEGPHAIHGMTLRDYFAAKALAGDFAAQDKDFGAWENSAAPEILLDRARLYYRMADAMIAARTAA